MQDSNPLLKESLQRGEDAAFWMKEKTREIIEATNLDRPLMQMDSLAAQTLEDVEKRTKKVIILFMIQLNNTPSQLFFFTESFHKLQWSLIIGEILYEGKILSKSQ